MTKQRTYRFDYLVTVTTPSGGVLRYVMTVPTLSSAEEVSKEEASKYGRPQIECTVEARYLGRSSHK
jgi:hypothetical protein